jgi:hypothetical protein
MRILLFISAAQSKRYEIEIEIRNTQLSTKGEHPTDEDVLLMSTVYTFNSLAP